MVEEGRGDDGPLPDSGGMASGAVGKGTTLSCRGGTPRANSPSCDRVGSVGSSQ